MNGHARNQTPLWVFGALLIVMLAGIWPRAANLDGLILWIDEDLTFLAAEGIKDHGVPVLPSGTVYSRGPVYSYVVGAMAAIGGLDVVMLRLPSVVFSLLLVFMTFYLGREIGGWAVGLAAAAVLTLSPWDIHYARMARMYELLALVVVVAVYLGVRYQVRDVARAGIPLALTLFVSLFVHRQAALLLPLFWVPLVLTQPAFRWRRAWLPTAAVVLGVLLITAFEQWAVLQGPLPVETPPQGGLTVPIIGTLDTNDTRSWIGELFTASPFMAIAGIAFAAVVGTLGAVRVGRKSSLTVAFAFVALIVSALSNQFFVALFFGGLTLKLWSTRSEVSWANVLEAALPAAMVMAVVFGVSIAGMGASVLEDRHFVRSWYSYPVPWIRLLLLQHPMLLIAAVASSVGIFFQSLREEADQAPFYVMSALWMSLFIMGFLPVHYFAHRYTFFINALLVVVFAYGTVELVRFAIARLSNPLARAAVAVGILAAAVGLSSSQFNPREAYAMPSRGFGYNHDVSNDRDVTASFHYDFTGAARHVMERYRAGDIIIARDPTNLYPYMGQLDYVLSGQYDGHAETADGSAVDWYLGIPYLGSVEDLRHTLDVTRHQKRWIIYTRKSDDGPNPLLSDEQLAFLDRIDHRRVFTGRDGLTVVLEIPPAARTADDDILDEDAG